jgi:molybdopterin-guanine dinucleotide biosynthesis protein A
MKITGIMLAGGNSSRMGKHKALVEYKGKKLIEWSISILKDLCDTIIISSNSKHLRNYGYEIIEDVHENIGPIGGLYAMLIADLE